MSGFFLLRTLCAVFFFTAATGSAHTAFESTAIAQLHPDRLEIKITMGLTTARAIEAKGGDLAPFEPSTLPGLRQRLLAEAGSLFEITSGPAPLSLIRASLEFDSENEASFVLIYPRPPAGPLRIRATHVSNLPYGGTYLTIQGESEEVLISGLVMAEELTLETTLPSSHAPPAASTAPAFTQFLRLGIEHILTGYDHLLFLLGVIVACRRVRTMAVIVTCFTLAHSLTLGLATLGLFSLSDRVVEPLIAGSIIFVGLENLVRHEESSSRAGTVFFFGLIHGFGFAGVLQNLGLGTGGRTVALPLFAFNLGVELGQLALVLLLFPALLWLQQRPLYHRRGYVLVSVVITCLGGYWLLRRTVFV